VNLQLSPIYQPDADEVLVEFQSTQDDGVTVTVADSVTAVLQVGVQDPLGAWSYRPIATIQTTSDYIQAQNSYEMKFRHPQRKQDLFVSITAIFGGISYSKISQVGIANEVDQDMHLPDNDLFHQDRYSLPRDQDIFEPANENQVVLNPIIQIYTQGYDFTIPTDPETFEPLTYTGGPINGGSYRLLMSNKTNAFESQLLNQPFWQKGDFAFMESEAQNLIPNSFFNVSSSPITGPQNGVPPQGFTVDPAGALLTQTLAPDYTTATGAQLWNLRFRQNNHFSAFNQATINLGNGLEVTPDTNYCLSVYARIKVMIAGGLISQLTLLIQWLDDNNLPISVSSTVIDPSTLQALSLASFSAMSPSNAVAVNLNLLLGSIDAGDDVALTLFAPQLEAGTQPTSRIEGSRSSDLIQYPDYNADNQKVRFELIAGFEPGQAVQVLDGPLQVFFTINNTVQAIIPGQATLEVPVTFQLGDTLDYTIQHQAGSFITLFRSGTQVGQIALPEFVSTPAPLSFLGFGGELLRTTVFSRN
jgi:hypothetical protein